MKKSSNINLENTLNEALNKAVGSETPPQPTPTTIPQDTKMEQLVQVFATTLSNALNQKDKEAQETKRLQEMEKMWKTAPVDGIASRTFKQQMEDEIARGDFVEMIYFEALAKKFGTVFNFTISGYTLHFQVNLATKIPKSLVNEVNMKFRSGNILQNAAIKVVDTVTQQVDNDLTNQAQGIINSVMNRNVL